MKSPVSGAVNYIGVRSTKTRPQCSGANTCRGGAVTTNHSHPSSCSVIRCRAVSQSLWSSEEPAISWADITRPVRSAALYAAFM